jgi:glyceraldehyde 3-phosphate dehydrogenase
LIYIKGFGIDIIIELKMKILINGVGRIGKSILRIALKNSSFDTITINEVNPNIKSIAYSINYDSTYGTIDDKFQVASNYIKNSTHKIEILNHKSIEDINLKDIDIIIDSSGSRVDVARLRELDIRAIFLTHPNRDADINIVLGVNGDRLNPLHHKIISTSSCNATALLPILQLIDENLGIEYGDIVTIHPMLNHQRVLDSGCIGSVDRGIECNLEFGRSATQNIIPSRTTTIEACSFVTSNINSNFISSSSLRVPTSTVGAIAVTLFIKKESTKEEIVSLCKEYQQNQKSDIILNNYEALVSSDFQGEKHTTIIDHRFTDVKGNRMVKLLIWYDNEWGYASKVVEIVEMVI